MYSSILNTEWDSNLTLTFRCCVSRTAIKLTNEGVINSVIDICIFQVIITVFKDFSLENFTLNFRTCHTFPGSVRTLSTSDDWTELDRHLSHYSLGSLCETSSAIIGKSVREFPYNGYQGFTQLENVL